MSKIICDICGTSYQDTAECCPICGCSKNSAADLFGDEVLTEEGTEELKGKARVAASRKKQIFDYDEANYQRKEESVDMDEEEPFDDEDEEDEERPRHNVFVVILLTILIAALLLAAGFIVVRFVLPNLGGGDEETVPVVTETQAPQTEATQLRIACETLVLQSGSVAELSEAGFSHLINVLVIPEDTTDTLTFQSADQSIATVSEDGKITAVGEGETIVTITCGDVQAYVNVSCDFTPEETTEATEADTEETESTEETTGETTDETTAETEGNKEIDPNVQLKLQKSDIRLGVYYQFQLLLDCDLEQKDVEWSSEHPHIATVDEEGNVTAVQAGTTAIIAKYGEQQVQCIIRCF